MFAKQFVVLLQRLARPALRAQPIGQANARDVMIRMLTNAFGHHRDRGVFLILLPFNRRQHHRGLGRMFFQFQQSLADRLRISELPIRKEHLRLFGKLMILKVKIVHGAGVSLRSGFCIKTPVTPALVQTVDKFTDVGREFFSTADGRFVQRLANLIVAKRD